MMGDFTSVYWIAGAIVVVLWVVQALLKSARPAIRGNIGEAVVSGRLGSLPNDVYKVINNVMLPTVDGATTQIDHVVVSRYGIFVVETKDYGGWIFGGENQRQWTQSFRTRWGADKYRFQNPIRQNWRHIYTMSDLLKMPRRYFFNVVAFCGDGEFMTEMPENVMYSADLARYIRSFDRPLLSEAMVEKVCLAIGAWDMSLGDERKALHVANLRASHDAVQLSVSCERGELKCPKCGAKMVLRHRKSDGAPFYGCSQYPKCKGIRNA